MKRIALALLFLIAGTQVAQAGFIVGALVAAAGITGAAATITTAVVTTALAVGASYVANELLGPDVKKKVPAPQRIKSPRTEFGRGQTGPVGGVELDIRVDGSVPQSVVFGRAVTAGSLVHAETYGKRGEVDNSDLIEIIALADHPCTGLHKVFVEGQARSLTGETVGGYSDKLFAKFYDGRQTNADALAVANLALHQRPWNAAMVGRGITYVRTHSIYDPDLVPGRLRWRFVVDGIALYDPRKDSTVGGSGAHRFDVLSTHEFSRNLAVIAYNILRGVRVADAQGVPRHFYGLEGTPADALPLDIWFAAMNECDLVVDGEPQYWGGAEVPVSAEPLETLREILKSCGGKLVENGGVYKLYLGPPGLPVVTFDDGALRADEGDTFTPILPLEKRINYVTGSYTRPGDGWLPREAPPRGDAAAEERDGRRVAADSDTPWVQSGKHKQRLQKQLLKRARQERRHKLPIPPQAWGLEPGDVVAWNSDRNGYAGKLFEVDAAEDYHNLNSTITVTEVDPTDYNWEPSTDLIAEADGELSVERPAPRKLSNFAAQGIVHHGTNNTVRPAIKLTWDDPEDADIVAVRVQYRNTTQPEEVATAYSDDPTAEALLVLGGVQSLTDYEVRARFESRNGFATEQTIWIPVFTPDARISLEELDRQMRAKVDQLDRQTQASIARVLDAVQGELDLLAHRVMGIGGDLDRQDNDYQQATGARVQLVTDLLETETRVRAAQITSLQAVLEATAASLLGQIAEVDDKHEALATLFGNVFAENEEGVATSMFRITAHAAPDGVDARVALEAKTEAGVYGTDSAALYLDTVAGLGSRAEIIAERFVVRHGTGVSPVIDAVGSDIYLNSNVRIANNLIVGGTIQGSTIQAARLTSYDEKFVIDLNAKYLRIVS